MNGRPYTVMIFYSQLFPKYDLTPIRCIQCSRMIMKVKGEVLWITNSGGIPVESQPVSLAYIEHQCHSCKKMYRVMFTGHAN